MPKVDTPIVWGHNYASKPIGFVKTEDGHVLLQLREDAGITVENVETLNTRFAPSYVITKEKDGIVQELEIMVFSALDNKHP